MQINGHATDPIVRTAAATNTLLCNGLMGPLEGGDDHIPHAFKEEGKRGWACGSRRARLGKLSGAAAKSGKKRLAKRLGKTVGGCTAIGERLEANDWHSFLKNTKYTKSQTYKLCTRNGGGNMSLESPSIPQIRLSHQVTPHPQAHALDLRVHHALLLQRTAPNPFPNSPPAKAP